MMTTNVDAGRLQRLAEVIDVALASDPSDWPEVLESACAGAPDLRREAEAMLERVDAARGLLSSPPAAAAAALLAEADADAESAAGRRIGAYAIVREIGRGGMSRVLLAHRADGHFEQRVALKLLHPGLDSDIDRARFRAERQIVASLDHPNIARLLDGGLTDAGQPYLVLEYVAGQPIDAYCDAHALSTRERIELFLMMCRATQYAHRNLIVHRDIKPSNILVNDEGVVKLLDFGLAKLVEPDVGARPGPAAQTVAHWMTPEYAAPEQIRHEPVTTLTDVYQLGAVLYRILTGHLPFSGGEGGLHELGAAVLRGSPTAPSVAIARSNPARSKELAGDLDAIVLKAIRAEPDARYESVEALADDLRRHLSRHAVHARRGSTWYRARRLVRRHRVEAIATAVVVISLLAGAAFSVSQARRAAAQRDLAAAASRESQAVSDFLMGLFEKSDPAEAGGDTLTAHDLVQRAAVRAERFRDRPLAQARMLEVTGHLYHGLGQYENARQMFARAYDIEQSAGAGGTPGAAVTLDDLAEEFLRLDRYGAADSAAREALRIQVGVLGPADPRVATTLHQIASVAVYRGQLTLAVDFERRALAVREKALGPDDTITAKSHLALGAMLRAEGRAADAERELRVALALLQRRLPPDSPRIADALLQIAYLLDEGNGNPEAEEPLYRHALEIRRRAFGDSHPLVAATLMDMAGLLQSLHENSAAVDSARRAFEIIRRAYGPGHPVVASFMGYLAAVLRDCGDIEESERLYREALALNRRVRGRDHDTNAGLEMGLARVLVAQRRFADAERAVNDALRIRGLAAGPDSPGTAAAEGLLGMVLTREGHLVAADSVLRESVTRIERQVGRSQREVREMHGWLADLEDARGQHDEAARDRAIAAAR